MRLRFIVAPSAKRQVKAVQDWWRVHRPAAPFLFEEELANARRALLETPDIGLLAHYSEIAGVRKYLLPRTRYHVYYLVDHGRQTLFVLAVWSALRGSGPKLVKP